MIQQFSINCRFLPICISKKHLFRNGAVLKNGYPRGFLLLFIENAKLYGLFPTDYHSHQLSVIKKIFAADAFKDKETQRCRQLGPG